VAAVNLTAPSVPNLGEEGTSHKNPLFDRRASSPASPPLPAEPPLPPEPGCPLKPSLPDVSVLKIGEHATPPPFPPETLSAPHVRCPLLASWTSLLEPQGAPSVSNESNPALPSTPGNPLPPLTPESPAPPNPEKIRLLSITNWLLLFLIKTA